MEEFDVAIVGLGPVGQTAAALLGQSGHRVVALERHEAPYDKPRAVHFDHEVMRIWQRLGIVETLAPGLLPVTDYHWFGADGDPILVMPAAPDPPSGWEAGYLVFQPELERALERAVQAQPNVDARRGSDVIAIRRHNGTVELEAAERPVRARYVIGADGANSFVRRAAGIGWDDLGFAQEFLTLDVRPHDIGALAHLPRSCQWCDPARPAMHTRNGRQHRRWEFMLLPGERADDFHAPERVWELLAPWMAPDEGELIRHAVYEFRSLLARSMRSGPLLLAGDAAHLMPPMMGQGMCAGIRDANNLAWKLDLVLRGLAPERLLDTYDAERRPHNEWIVRLSMEMGRVSCELDPAAAAARDTTMRASDAPPAVALPPLAGGVLARGPAAGALAVQGSLRGGRTDNVLGPGFKLVVARGVEVPASDLLDRLGVQTVSLTDDADGRLTAWLASLDAVAVLVRPDFVVFGAARTADGLPALVEDLRTRLDPDPTGAPPMPDPVIRPKLHHINLKTTRLDEMIDWYATLLGCQVLHRYELGAWISNDAANHRIALLAFPGFSDDPDRDTRTGLHHVAFEYGRFEDLDDSYLRLKGEGIVPAFCLDHGMTLSYYYADPDGNHVELQVDNFGDWARSSEYMRSSTAFEEDPLGKFVDPDQVAEARREGLSHDQIHALAFAGELAPEAAPVELPSES